MEPSTQPPRAGLSLSSILYSILHLNISNLWTKREILYRTERARYHRTQQYILTMVVVRRILLVVCVTSVVIGITITLLAPSHRSSLGHRSLRNGENAENDGETTSRRSTKFYDLSRFTNDEVSGEWK
jgi:hypothetical protein